MNPIFAKFTLALMSFGLVTREAQLWGHDRLWRPF